MSDIYMRILLSAVGGSGVISAVQSVAQSLGGSSGLGGALLGVGVAAAGLTVGLGVAAVKAAGDFQSGLTSLVTGAGEAQSNLGMVSNGILKMAVDTGTSTKQLIDGMYLIESSGIHGADGLRVLQAAAEGAKVGSADLGTVAGAVTTVLTDYHLSSDKATIATNALLTVVASGKTHLQDLASSMGTVLPLASNLGIAFPQVGGAIATMTNAGMTAQNAAHNLANAIRSLSAPNGAAVKSMTAVGLKAQDLKNALVEQGLPGALQLIEDHVGKKFPAGSVQAIAAFKSIMGGATGYNVSLMLGGKNMAAFQGNIEAVSKSMGAGGNSVNGWALVQQNFNFKMAQASAMVETLMIKIGQVLLPTVTALVDKLMPVISRFGEWLLSGNRLQNGINLLVGVIKNLVTTGTAIVAFFQHNQVAMVALIIGVIALAGAIGGILVAAFVAMAIAAWAALVPLLPFIAIGAAVALVIAGIVWAILNWSTITTFFQEVWGAFLSWLTGVWSAFSSWFMSILGSIGVFFTGIWSGIVSWWKNMWTGATTDAKATTFVFASWWSGIWNSIVNALKTAWNFIVNAVKVGVLALVSIVFAPIIAIAALFVWLYNHNYYFKALCDSIVSFFQAALAWLHSAWTATISWLTSAWSNIVNAAKIAWFLVSNAIQSTVQTATDWLENKWNVIGDWLSSVWMSISNTAKITWFVVTSAIQSAVQTTWSWLVSVWTTITGWLGSQWNSFAGLASQAWQAVSSVFSSIWDTYISGPLSSLWASLSSWFSGLASQAYQWAVNMIQSFISGITNMAGSVGSAASGIASQVASFLGFHSPAKEGEGRDLDKWPRNMVASYAAGLKAGLPQIQAAVSVLAQPLGTLGQSPPVSPSATSGTANTGHTIVFSPNLVLQGLDETSLEQAGQWLMTYLGDQVRNQYGNV